MLLCASLSTTYANQPLQQSSGGINNNIDIGIEVLIFYQFLPSVSDAFVWPFSLKQMKVAISSHMGTRWTENGDEGSRHVV